MYIYCTCLKKNLNASTLSEHPPVRGKILNIIGCKYKTSLCMAVTLLGQQYYNVGEKPTTVILLYTYIDRHAGTPNKKQKLNKNNVVQHPTW